MTIATDFVTTLTSTFSGRLYPSVAPAGVAQPYGTYELVSGIPETAMEGVPNLVNSRMSLHIFGRDKATIDALAESAKAAMIAASVFKSIVLNQLDLFEDPAILYHVMVDFSIWRYN